MLDKLSVWRIDDTNTLQAPWYRVKPISLLIPQGFFLGRTMKTSHAGLGITEQDWHTTIAHLTAALDHVQTPPQEKEEVLALVAPLKDDIVET